jgi:hypothetical protein
MQTARFRSGTHGESRRDKLTSGETDRDRISLIRDPGDPGLPGGCSFRDGA